MKSQLAILITFVAIFQLCSSKEWTVTTKRVNGGKPVIQSGGKGNGGSSFDWNYNAAWMRSPHSPLEGGLLVRCQNKTSNFYTPTPSYLTYAKLVGNLKNLDKIEFEYISDSNIRIQPSGPNSAFGTEDPRAVYNPRDDSYEILYSAVSAIPKPVSQLSAAVVKSSDINTASKWKKYGHVFDTKNVTWSKSGSLLLRESSKGKDHLFWGDGPIYYASSSDGLHFQNTGYPSKPFINMRKEKWDSLLVEGGPNPFKLSDGNYLMLYNSARRGFPSKKPDWDVQYNIGFVILNGKKPTEILYRSENPIFSPELSWETADGTGLTPNVVFVEGWTTLEEKDTFLFFYGAADSYVGAATLKVSIKG